MSHFDIDDPETEEDEGPFDFDAIDWEHEEEQCAMRGTSECDGLCDPQCSWCLIAHYCPDDCAGGECPYESLAKAEQSRTASIKCEGRRV